jgi:hypothetical protein
MSKSNAVNASAHHGRILGHAGLFSEFVTTYKKLWMKRKIPKRLPPSPKASADGQVFVTTSKKAKRLSTATAS